MKRSILLLMFLLCLVSGETWADVLSDGGLVRITNRRTTTAALTDNGNGTLGSQLSATDYSQVWILTPTGGGYTLQNGNTGRYLDDDNEFRSPSKSATILHIQASTNANGFYNITESSTFNASLNDCLNLNEDGTTLYKWTFSNDPGSDWNITTVPVSEFTLDQVKANIKNNNRLVRVTNRRNSNAALADNGSTTLGAVLSKTDYSQVWLLTAVSGGYTLRNGNTGRYLNDDDNFRTPSTTATTLQIQVSPNNSSYFNITESASFTTANDCLNLNGDGTTLYKWTYVGDAGSDWAITDVPETEYTTDQVYQNLRSKSGLSEPVAGAYYRIKNIYYNNYMYENSSSNKLSDEAIDENKLAQYWTLVASGNGYLLQNLLTQRYITPQRGVRSVQYGTQTTKPSNVFTLTRTSDETLYAYSIDDNNGIGLHCDGQSNVVGWDTSITPSMWGFEKVELSDDFITEARKVLGSYSDVVKNRSAYQASLDNLFSDKACTMLKSNIAGLTDAQLEENSDYAALPEAIKEMVLKVKNNTWAQTTTTSTVTDSYEKFFRIASYKPYSNYTEMAGGNYTYQSNMYGKLSGPTGITLKTNDILYIYVDANASSDCTLQAEIVKADDNAGGHQSGTTTNLTAGLNVLQANEQSNVYIFYQLNDCSKYLANYNDIKIHLEGGTVNGCFDVTRGMKNQDWANMRDLGMMEASPVLNMKTEHLVFAMDAPAVISAMTAAQNSAGDTQADAEKLMRIWDTIVDNEERLQGLDDFAGRLRNVWNCFSVNSAYMYATSYGTYYNTNTLPTVMNYYELTHQSEGNEGGALWGPSHEMGHNHQAAINLIGTTESSNNMFSNINLFEQGVSTTRYQSPVANFTNLADQLNWNSRNISVSTRMFFQLYLYFHVAKGDSTFYPRVFKAMRADKISRGNWDNTLTADTDGDGTADYTTGYKSYGKDDYLKFAKTVCKVANADLSEFFESYGMFIPEDNQFVGDYSNYWVTTTQADIDAAKTEMKSYSTKLNNIMFIDDHIVQKPANADNKFEAVPASSGMKVNCGTYEGSKVGTAGTLGDYESYSNPQAGAGNTYSISNGVISFLGTDYVGYKIYDTSGNLIWACNSDQATIPSSILSLFPNDVVVKAASATMEDAVMTFNDGENATYATLVRTNVKPYYEAGVIPFGLTQEGINQLDEDGYQAALNSCSVETYNKLLADVSQYINIPTDGYYRIQSSGSRSWGKSFIGVGNNSTSRGTAANGYGLRTVTASAAAADFSTVIKFTRVTNLDGYVYKLSTETEGIVSPQGLNYPFELTAKEDQGNNFIFKPVSGQPGMVTIQDATITDGNGFFHETDWNENKSAVVRWSDNEDASHWQVSALTEDNFSIAMQQINGENYASLALPFGATISGAKAYVGTVDEANKRFILQEIGTTIPAGTPVILLGENSAAKVTINTNATATIPQNSLSPIYWETAVNTQDYYLGTYDGQAGFYKANINKSISNRAYLKSTEVTDMAAKGYTFDLTTGLNTISIDNNSNINSSTPRYNLQGQRVDSSYKGVVIVNGRKMIIKK